LNFYLTNQIGLKVRILMVFLTWQLTLTAWLLVL